MAIYAPNYHYTTGEWAAYTVTLAFVRNIVNGELPAEITLPLTP